MPSVRSRLAPVSARIVKLWATSEQSAEGRTIGETDGARASPVGLTAGAALAFPLAPARYRDPVAVLEARGIRKSVGSGRARRWVLDGAALTVEADEVVAVLGRSGSGKSTLLHLLGALDRPDAGEIVLAGQTLTAQGSRELARTRLRHVGFVFQSFHLVPELSGSRERDAPGAPSGRARRG